MTANPALEKYLRAVDRSQQELRGALSELRNSMVRGNEDNKTARAKEAKKAIHELSRMFHEQDVPQWAIVLGQLLDQFLASQSGNDRDNHAENLMSHLFKFKDLIYDLSLTTQPSPIGLDFEATYTEKFRASPIPGLFDRLVALLETIIDSGEIDSNKALKSLQALIALLKKNRTSSYSSAQWAWSLFCAATRNILYRYAEESDALGPMVRGIEDAIEETNAEFDKVRKESAAAVRGALRFDVPGLDHRPEPRGISGPIVEAEFEALPQPDCRTQPGPSQPNCQ